MDREGRITALNAAAERLLSTSAADAIGQLYTAIFGRSLSDRMLGLFQRLARSGQPDAPQVLTATLPGGGRATLRATVGPMLGPSGQLLGMLFAAEDLQPEEPPDIEADRLRAALRRYVGEAIASMVEERPSFVGVGGRVQEVSVLHTDVRGYTTVAEQMPPDELLRVLSRFHGAATAAIQAEGGSIDRFIGDAILALWNAPAPQPDHCRRAIRGALAMRDATLGAGDELAYGIGVHTGEAIVGNLGSEHYANFTAIGDTINVAARLQAAALGGEIVCSAAALAAAGPGVRATPLGELSVKGRKQPIEAYQLEGIEE